MISLLKKKYFSYASYAMRKIIMRRHQYMYLNALLIDVRSCLGLYNG